MQDKGPIVMHGPAFTEEREFVERVIPYVDIVAFEKAGYVRGPLPDHLKPAPKAEPKAEPKAQPKAQSEPKAK